MRTIAKATSDEPAGKVMSVWMSNLAPGLQKGMNRAS